MPLNYTLKNYSNGKFYGYVLYMYFTTIFKKRWLLDELYFWSIQGCPSLFFWKCAKPVRRQAEVSKPVSSRSLEIIWGRVHVVCSNFLKPNQKLCWPRGLLQDRVKVVNSSWYLFHLPCSLMKHMITLREGTVIPHFEQGMLRLRESLWPFPDHTAVFLSWNPEPLTPNPVPIALNVFLVTLLWFEAKKLLLQLWID